MLLCLLAVAGLLLACSSGSRPNADSPESYADAICRAWSKHADEIRLSQEVSTVNSGESQPSKESASAMASLEDGVAHDLAKIEAPGEIAGLHAEIVESHRQAAQAWTGVEQALDRGAGDVSSAFVQDALSAVARARASEPTLPDEYQQAIQNNQDCKTLEEEVFPPRD